MKKIAITVFALGLFISPLATGAQINREQPGDNNGNNDAPVGPDLTETELSKRAIVTSTDRQISAVNDTDADGISDIDEVEVYGTDPESAATNPESVTITTNDGVEVVLETDEQKLLNKVNPVTNEPITYEDPRLTSNEVVSGQYQVSRIAKIPVTDNVVPTDAIQFSGSAPAYSFVTLHIFSTPIVVTVKADRDGLWRYTLQEELEDGSHTMFASTVDNTGRILARSDAVPFVKTAAAAGFAGAVDVIDAETAAERGFLSLPVLLILTAVFVIFILGAITFAGAAARKAGVGGPGVPGGNEGDNPNPTSTSENPTENNNQQPGA